MTLEINQSSFVPENPKRCDNIFVQGLRTIAKTALGLFSIFQPIAETSSVDLSTRTVAQRAERQPIDLGLAEEDGWGSDSSDLDSDSEITGAIGTSGDCEVEEDYIDPESMYDWGIVYT